MQQRLLMLALAFVVTGILAGPASARATQLPEVTTPAAPAQDEACIPEDARALVISHVEPNELSVGGREFRVKRNPVGEGCFVYDPRTRFNGTARNLVWWVPEEGKAYPLNSPRKMVTPGLNWPRE